MISLLTDGMKDNQVNKMVIPFAYDCNTPYQQLIGQLCNSETNKWQADNIKEANNELYEHILSLIADDITRDSQDTSMSEENHYIAQALKMNRSHTNYPGFQLTCSGLSPKISFSFEQINLILFTSGIGFLVMSMDYSQFNELDQVIIANNEVKAIKHCKLYKVETRTEFIELDRIDFSLDETADTYQVIDDTDNKSVKYILQDSISVSKETIKELRIINKGKQKVLKIKYNKISTDMIQYKKLINDILSDMNVVTYFNQSFSKSINRKMSSKANVFSAVVIKGEEHGATEISKAFFRLRKGYSNSYNPNEMEFISDNEEVFKPFDDSFWGVSREGCANLTYDANEFMKFGYGKRITTYFYLYIIALHQYYGLLNIAKDISYLPNNIDDCAKEANFVRLKSIRNRCNFFYMKAVFDEVSHITHQALYYNRLINVLGIRNMQEELNFEIDRISTIVEQVNDKNAELRKDQELKAEREHEKKLETEKEHKNFILSMIGLIFGLFSIISILESSISFWTSMSDIYEQFKSYEFINSIITIAFILLLCIVLSLLFLIINKLRRKNKIK